MLGEIAKTEVPRVLGLPGLSPSTSADRHCIPILNPENCLFHWKWKGRFTFLVLLLLKVAYWFNVW